MAGKKTSVEQTRDEEKLAQVGNMLDAAFGDVGGLQAPVDAETEEPTPGPEAVSYTHLRAHETLR